MTTKPKLTPTQDLVLHIMYEFQFQAGKTGLTQAEIEMHCADALFDFGTPEAAIKGIRERCGLGQR